MKLSLVLPILALAKAALAVHPHVNLGYSQYVGVPLDNSVTQWLGIRYAAPPLGSLRFKEPQPPLREESIQPADQHGAFCLSYKQYNRTDSGEDCLFLDVFAPSSATRHSKLPVLVYIQGGGFAKNADANNNGTGLVEAADLDLVVVFFNYRVGPWGFLTTGEERDDVGDNVGLLDQRMVLQWVQSHIHKFGGDPDHVVIGGDSAGGASVTLQLAAYDGSDRGLFVGAMGESASFGPVLTASQSRYQYVQFAKDLGCWHGTDNSHHRSSHDTKVLACLRSKTELEIQAVFHPYTYPASIGPSTGPALYMWSPFIDGDFIRDLTYKRFAEGYYVHVPTIFGDVSNGGTIYAPQNTSTLEESNAFLRNQFPTVSDAQLAVLDDLYPNPNASSCAVDQNGCYWRQAANMYGEVRYLCPSLYLSGMLSKPARGKCHSVPATHNYLWDVHDPTDDATGYGVTHVVETYPLFGPSNVYFGGSPASYLPGGINEVTSKVIQGYWTSFARSLSPNKFRYEGTAEWKPWGERLGVIGNRLRFETGGGTRMERPDEALWERCEYVWSIGLDLYQ